MRRAIFIIGILAIVSLVFAGNIVIHKNDGSSVSFEISEIDSITFDVSSSEPLWIATIDYYPETANLDSIVTALYGSNYRVADWNDLVSYSQTHDIVAWADSIGMLNSSSYGFWVTRDGYHFWSGNRHYYIERHDGVVPGWWLVHATINNHFIDLGSWYSMSLRILCFRIN